MPNWKFTSKVGQVVSQTKLEWDGKYFTAENPKRKLIIRELDSLSKNKFVGTMKGLGAMMELKPGDLVSFDVKFNVNNRDGHLRQEITFNHVLKLEKVCL